MNRNDQNWFNMFNTVKDFMTAKKSEFPALSYLWEVHQQLENQIKLIAELDAQSGQTSKGFSAAKTAIRKDLEKNLIKLVAYLMNVATFTNQVVLLHEIDFKDNQLKKASEQMLVSRGEFLLQKARANEQAALEFGMPAEYLVTTEQLLNDYKVAQTTPRQAIVGSVDVNARLDEEMEATNNLIKNKLDVVMKLVKIENPILYGQYKSARVIVDR